MSPLKNIFLLCLLLFVSCNARAQTPPSYKFLDDEAEPQFDLSFQTTPSDAGALVVVFDYKDARNFYTLELASPSAKERTVTLKSTLAGVEHKLASASVTFRSGSEVTLQRRPWLMRVLIDKAVVLTAYDAALKVGRIGFRSNGRWTYAQPRVQPVEETIYFNDDFTRTSGQRGEWKTLAGDWKITAASEGINAGNQDMSANPFSYQASASRTLSLAQTGRKFWDNFDVGVSVRPVAQGTIGLASYVLDANNYVALLWNSRESNEARRLVMVANGRATVLAKGAGAYLPRQWYRVALRTSPGFLETFIDGVLIFRVRSDAFGQGGIALLAQDTAVNFDDVRVRSFPYYRQDFAGPTGGAWTPNGGFWRADGGALNSAPKPGDGGATRTLIAGDESWSNYEFSASAKVGDAGGVGLMAGYRDDKNFLVYRWAADRSTLPFKGRAQLLRYKDGKAEILSDEKAPQLDADGYLRVKMRFVAGALTVVKDGEIVAQAADEDLRNGRPGLWAQGAPVVSFREVVMYLPPEADPPQVAPRFEKDALMVGWASPAGEWPPRKTNAGLEFWNTGEFFGDGSVEYIWRPALNANGVWELTLHASDGAFESGTIVRVEGKDTLKISLLRKGAVLKSGEVTLKQVNASDANPPKLRVEMEGRAILVAVNATPVLSYLPKPEESVPTGTRIAARAQKFIIAAKDLRAISANRDDYTFSEAPTDWYAPQGTWSIFHRWPCYSDWSFFGGTGTAPMIWSKREYSGDTVVEFYSHPQMNLPKEIGYAHPGDLNVSLCGDGKSPASGYSFVLAGWFNTKTAIMKGNTIVAQTDSAPNATFDRPINQNSYFHRKWFYIRAEARRETRGNQSGVHLKYFVDNQLMCEYFDPNPPPSFEKGGRVVFWTVGGAMMIARAKIESQNLGTRALPVGLLDAAAQNPSTVNSGDDLRPQPVEMDGLPSAFIEKQADAWKISNPNSGGIFDVEWKRGGGSTLRVTPQSKLECDVQIPPEARIDAYLTIGGVRYCVEISGGQRADARVKKLGTATLENSTGNWKSVSFPLGDALKKLFPNDANWTIEKLEFGALHGDEYRWAGFFGNALGASYEVKNLRF